MERMLRKPFTDRFASLKNEAEQWKPAWQDIQTYICPTKGFFDDTPNHGRTINHKKVVNGHATKALNTLSSGLTSGLTSPSRPWFRLGLADHDLAEFEPVKEWLAGVQMRMMAVYSKSNIYGVLNSVYGEVGGFGTGACIVLPDYKDVIRGRNFTTGEYFLGTGADNRVNAFARKIYYTVGQLIEEFGLENVSEQVKIAYNAASTQGTNIDKWVTVCHLVEFNDKRIDDGRGRFHNKSFRSLYWEEGSPTDTFLRVTGFEEFPILAPRWDTTTTADIYGRGPGWDVLGDVKMLQKMEIAKLKALDKVVDPPLQADASVEEVNTLPGGVTRSSAMVPNVGARPLFQIQPDFTMIENSISKTEYRISEGFYANLFMMIAQSDKTSMTAREIVERHEEKLLMLGPVLERLESELLDPLIDRTFSIMLRAGLIPPPPEELQGADLKVEYVSMLAQAQKMVGTAAIQQLAGFAGNIAAVYPEALDNLDPDVAINEMGEMLGVPPKLVRSPEAVAAIRDRKAKDAQAQQVAAAIPAAVTGAKTLSETPMNNGSALDALLGTSPADAVDAEVVQ